MLTNDTIRIPGFTDFFRARFLALQDDSLLPARVIRTEKSEWTLETVLPQGAGGEAGPRILRGVMSGRLRHRAEAGEAERPVTGDWVAAALAGDAAQATAVVHAVLERSSAVYRNAAGEETVRQVVAANVDAVLVVTAIDRDFNQRRLERYATVLAGSGARVIVVINKVDLESPDAGAADAAPDAGEGRRDPRRAVITPGEAARLAARAVPGALVMPASARTGEGLDDIAAALLPGETIALVGSSGVGKSSILNRLAGRDLRAVNATRAGDGRGRHTTTNRELFTLPSGLSVIDTPGMKELQLWCESAGIESAFPEIEELAASCRFRNCTHSGEPGCAVQAALESGELDPARYENWVKLNLERDSQSMRLRERDRKFGLMCRDVLKQKEIRRRLG